MSLIQFSKLLVIGKLGSGAVETAPLPKAAWPPMNLASQIKKAYGKRTTGPRPICVQPWPGY